MLKVEGGGAVVDARCCCSSAECPVAFVSLSCDGRKEDRGDGFARCGVLLPFV